MFFISNLILETDLLEVYQMILQYIIMKLYLTYATYFH